MHRVQDRIEYELDRTLPLRILASAEATSERTLTRAFVAATGTTPLRYQQTLRLEHAQSLIARGVSIDSAARQVGFADARMLRRLRSAERQRPD
ncbi:helix-turn-helix domain-containing protein [Naumannella halotolerans]|uniref:helix-turn-helix domain-containing protein n=1 Tax=Naumannella halotolerans TaxID=993414 RepID=UPI001FBA7BAE|nr:helix-turn-helix domain-containing protein [Naumannella halotolerans]